MEQAHRLDGEERIIQARTVLNAVQMSMDSQSPQSRAEAEAALRNWVGYCFLLRGSAWAVNCSILVPGPDCSGGAGCRSLMLLPASYKLYLTSRVQAVLAVSAM